ncbi:hypothetical protein AALO_G00256890, partial [Alosa alosa]
MGRNDEMDDRIIPVPFHPNPDVERLERTLHWLRHAAVRSTCSFNKYNQPNLTPGIKVNIRFCVIWGSACLVKIRKWTIIMFWLTSGTDISLKH